ncbi:MAG: c-type cytochrome [Myxococcota bacterium]
MRIRLILGATTLVVLGISAGMVQGETQPPAGEKVRPLPPPSGVEKGQQERPQVPAGSVPGTPKKGEPEAVTGAALAEARNIFVGQCVQCHGNDGSGAGPMAVLLKVRPRNWQDDEWQRRTTDEQIAKVILEGGPALGLSAEMPAFPALKQKPDVVRELVKMVRTVGR